MRPASITWTTLIRDIWPGWRCIIILCQFARLLKKEGVLSVSLQRKGVTWNTVHFNCYCRALRTVMLHYVEHSTRELLHCTALRVGTDNSWRGNAKHTLPVCEESDRIGLPSSHHPSRLSAEELGCLYLCLNHAMSQSQHACPYANYQFYFTRPHGVETVGKCNTWWWEGMQHS
jgi:hypothetical protein